MALRRLLSGWLIAVAALARSMAVALERATTDRPEPASNRAPGSVMAALAERYPGAPEHWLALVAERTAQLADTGEAPLSLSSQPSAWPSSLSGAAAPLEPMTPAGAEDSSRAPRPVLRALDATSTSRGDAVPSLATLQGRSSEVWRRPAASRGRRPRPVFAPMEPVPALGEATSEGRAPTGRRPRSPPTLEAVAPSSPPPDAPSLAKPSFERGARDKAGSEVETVGPEGSVEQRPTAQSLMPPAPSFATERDGANRFEASAPGIDAPPVVPSVSRFLSRAAPAASPSARQTSTFPPPDLAQPIDTAARRGPSFSMDRRAIPSDQADHPPFPPASRRSRARRSIFQTLAALVGRPRGVRVRHDRAASKSPTSRIGTLPAVLGTDHGARSPRPDLGMGRSNSLAATEPVFERGPSEADAPRVRAEPRTVAASAPRGPSPAWASPFMAAKFANDEAPRARFAIPYPSSADDVAPGAVRSSPDDRWPRFPPAVFPSPRVAEIPAPRLDQLAREQEEGRWSV